MMPKFTARIVLIALVCLAASAYAQWQWLDKDGKRVFSDRAPTADVPEKNILKRPGRPATAAAAAAASPATSSGQADGTAAAAAAPAGNVIKLPSADKELEARKKAATDLEAAKRKADEERVAKGRAENCSRAIRDKNTVDSGVRMARTNEKGEREVFDDAMRAAESKRLKEIMDTDCR